jgi:hypothetical protein
MSMKPRLIVLGLMGRIPVAGVAWQVLHYLEGFRRLGCDVYYVEDTWAWTHKSCDAVGRIARLMNWCGLSDRWAYRIGPEGSRIFGLSGSRVTSLFQEADALISLSSPMKLREEHLQVPVRIYLETDPVAPQIELARGDPFTTDMLRAHTHHFTFAENLGAPDCSVPVEQFRFCPTRQPVVLDWWTSGANPQCTDTGSPSAASRFTTIASWQHSGRDIEWNGETYFWSKRLEFMKFVELPGLIAQPIELALACDDDQAKALLRSQGWQVVDPTPLSEDILSYRDYILDSRGEFTVAKDQYVRPRSGWFSDRSACYLAAGKPVITQDTGFGNVLPTGRGLFAFQTLDQIRDAFEQINADYMTHSRAARELAAEYFAAEKVLSAILERVDV